MGEDNEIPYFLGSEDLFGEFFQKHYHTACLVANRYVKDIQASEDLVQDVFVALWNRRSLIGKSVNLKGYLLTAVKNHALNIVQRKNTSVASLSTSFIDLPEEETFNAYDKEEMAIKILQAIDELPPRCKTIFNMAYQQGMSYQQIADKLEISKNSVKTQMGIAYRSLRTKISPSMVVLLFILRRIKHI